MKNGIDMVEKSVQDGYSEMQESYETIEKCRQSVEPLTNTLNDTVKQFKI